MKDKQKTQQDIAKAAGVSQQAVSGWLKGSLPGVEQIKAAADCLGVSFSWLLNWTERGSVADAANYADIAREVDAMRELPEADRQWLFNHLVSPPLRHRLAEIRETADLLSKQIREFESDFAGKPSSKTEAFLKHVVGEVLDKIEKGKK